MSKPLLLVFLALAVSLAAVQFLGGQQSVDERRSLTIVVPYGPDRLDPCELQRSIVGHVLKQNIIETLVELDYSDGSVMPRLAERWERSGPNEWIFHLREGVEFHDGTPLDAEAVVYSMERMLDPNLSCITRTKHFDGHQITARAEGDYIVRFTTAEPIPILPTMMAQMGIASTNTPKGQYFGLPIGTGPFRFDSWDYHTEKVMLRRNAQYWGKRPSVETVYFIWRSDPSVAADMVEAGEADIALSIPPQLADDPEMDKVYYNSESMLFRLSVGIPPLDDVRVRKAINMAIDRRALQGTIISDRAQIATQQIGPNISGWNPDLVPWAYDPAEARRLLAAARADGAPVDTEIRLIGPVNFFPNSDKMVEAVAGMLGEVGLNIVPEALVMSLWLQEANKPFAENRKPTMLLTQHDNNTGDAASTLFFKYHSQGRQSELIDPRLDAMIVAADDLSGQDRVDAHREIMRVIYDDLVSDVPLFHMVNWMRVNARIEFQPTIANSAELQIAHMTFK